ncbi:hypothetical protein [Cystobacter ferrugineus]|uniref:hypothetical protein n=1 Tax=Cystobacter ferrugineus TaxID=83449 RepID=UPI0016511420|nr:hypothetical protein [Cystobacter ferrugineus]
MATGLGRHLSREDLQAAGVLDAHGKPIVDPSRNIKTVEQGAATSVWCATSPRLDGLGGVYCENCDIARVEDEKATARGELQGSARQTGVMPYAVDPEAARRLWILSERLSGTTLSER